MTDPRTRPNHPPAADALPAAHTVDITSAALDAIRDEAARGYPEEVCGILVGRERDGRRTIESAVPVANAREGNRSRRYLIPADSLRSIERDAAAQGAEIVGFYHSHPDHPATPSTYDRDHSWPWYTYVIVAVSRDPALRGFKRLAGAVAGDVRAWQLANDRMSFVEQEMSEPATPGANQKPAPETSPRNEVFRI